MARLSVRTMIWERKSGRPQGSMIRAKARAPAWARRTYTKGLEKEMSISPRCTIFSCSSKVSGKTWRRGRPVALRR